MWMILSGDASQAMKNECFRCCISLDCLTKSTLDLTIFSVGEGLFSSCFSIKVTCTANIIKILPISFDDRGRTETDSANDGEKTQWMSVVGSLSFTTRMAQPWKQYDASRLQSITKCANVSQLHYCNEVLVEAKEQAELGHFYRAGAFVWNDLITLSIGDASWANDLKIVDDKVFPRRNSYGRITILADPNTWSGEKGIGYYASSKSRLIHRVCQSTMRAETHG